MVLARDALNGGRLRRGLARVPWLLALAMLVLAGAKPGSAAAAAPAAAAQSLALLTSEVSAYAGALGAYRNGIWATSNNLCWACNQGGPATAAATVYMLTGKSHPNLLREAEATVDTAIATRQLPDGAFAGPPGDPQSPEVATMFFGVEEGNIYLELSPVLDRVRRARWQASIAAAASYLIHHGNLTWYTSGNINLGNAELFYLASKATGSSVFAGAYQQALSFAISPPQDRWPRRGLMIVRQPTRADGSDGAGYLTETGAGGTGYDTEYTQLQLDIASRVYLLSGDPRLLHLSNLLVNMLLPRINSSFMLNTSGGTRHTEHAREVPLLTSAFAVLGLHGGRGDLVPLIIPELAELQQAYADPINDHGEVYRRALGNDVSVIALAAQRPGAPSRQAGSGSKAARLSLKPGKWHAHPRRRRGKHA
jgi:hypothetical protein